MTSFNLGNKHERWALLQMGKLRLRELGEFGELASSPEGKTEPHACLAPRPVSAPGHLNLPPGRPSPAPPPSLLLLFLPLSLSQDVSSVARL